VALLDDIQAAVLDEGTDLGPILLKVRLLAARLGSQPLADWVKHESEGYPPDSPLPEYRIISVSYTGNFSGPFGSGIKNAPIPPYLIEKFAGEKWTRHEMRQSIAAVDDLLASAKDGGSFNINAANLILLLQGKVYEDYACNSVTGTVSRAALAEIRHAVRSRLLELMIALERSVPEASTIVIGKKDTTSSPNSAVATQISQQIIYGDVTTISATGDYAHINVAIGKGDVQALIESLTRAGISESDAKELGRIVVSEKPDSKDEPLGAKAKTWLLKNLKKAVNGTWKVGVSVATAVIKEAVLKYYGLK
jgi:RNase P protein component